jgi:hypothetical protein
MKKLIWTVLILGFGGVAFAGCQSMVPMRPMNCDPGQVLCMCDASGKCEWVWVCGETR